MRGLLNVLKLIQTNKLLIIKKIKYLPVFLFHLKNNIDIFVKNNVA